MSTPRKIALAALVIAMALSIWIFWGSIFSILVAMCLILLIPALLMRKYLDRHDDYYSDE